MRQLVSWIVVTSVISVIAGCASSGNTVPKLRTLEMAEASAFEKSLQTRPYKSPERPPHMFVQPVNKKEPCKLHTSQNQLDRENFRAFWDGQCRDGFAFGLGRDIAISDTHHLEQIITYRERGDGENSPSVLFDFVHENVTYRVPTGEFPAASIHNQYFSSKGDVFNVWYELGTIDELGDRSFLQYSPLNTTQISHNIVGTVAFKFTDNSQMPVVDAVKPVLTGEIIDPESGRPGGVAIVRYGSGAVRHFLLKQGAPEAIILPTEYANHMVEKYKAVQGAVARANTAIETAQQIEKEYLYKACNDSYTMEGLDNLVFKKICNWRDQYKQPFEKAYAKHVQFILEMKQKAEAASQQVAAQQRIAEQQAQVQKQESQRELSQLADSFRQLGQQIQNGGQQMLNDVRSQSSPQVNFAPFQPFSPFGGNTTSCVTVGMVTNCH